MFHAYVVKSSNFVLKTIISTSHIKSVTQHKRHKTKSTNIMEIKKNEIKSYREF